MNREIYFENEICEHGASVFHYIYSLVRHKELAEDLYQEVLLSAYLALGQFEQKAKLKSWMYTIALNKCRDYWRKEKGRQRFWQENACIYCNDYEAGLLTEEYVIKKQADEAMQASIKELPARYQDPLLLFYFKGCSLAEISRETGLPLSTVKTRMKRGKEQLRPKLKMLAVQ
ncbi:RNA polymerase factor sigma C [Bacillus sp. V3-13]|uniref:RNA polymerase sigma factor n=1 Tax=Bacillus sp. V3-13 TaxID=2053728 RepID=UPI000C770955|nr:RNA polymerase sigma factor [Bacillus sp. V3-13]PLR76904.1 RNA polymerase factor sigma C [Bacillus sp. V3-13]